MEREQKWENLKKMRPIFQNTKNSWGKCDFRFVAASRRVQASTRHTGWAESRKWFSLRVARNEHTQKNVWKKNKRKEAKSGKIEKIIIASHKRRETFLLRFHSDSLTRNSLAVGVFLFSFTFPLSSIQHKMSSTPSNKPLLRWSDARYKKNFSLPFSSSAISVIPSSPRSRAIWDRKRQKSQFCFFTGHCRRLLDQECRFHALQSLSPTKSNLHFLIYDLSCGRSDRRR